MAPPSDLQGEMPRSPLDDNTVEGVLRGAVSPDDAPPELRHVAALVEIARRGPEGDELTGADLAAAGFAAAVAGSAGSPAHPRRRPMFKKLTPARLLAIAAPVALLGAGSAAAASNSLPAPAQSAVSSALSHLDVSVPNPDAHGTDTPDNSKAVGPDAGPTSPATFGLCEAVTHGGLKNPNSPPYRNLLKAAGSGGIASYCAGIIAAHNANASTNPSTNGGSGDDGTETGPSAGTGTGSNDGTDDGANDGTDNDSTGAPFTTPPKGKPASHP